MLCGQPGLFPDVPPDNAAAKVVSCSVLELQLFHGELWALAGPTLVIFLNNLHFPRSWQGPAQTFYVTVQSVICVRAVSGRGPAALSNTRSHQAMPEGDILHINPYDDPAS